MKIQQKILIICLLLPTIVMAARVEGLYEGQVPIIDKSIESQNRGIRGALMQSLVKLTGKTTASEIYGVQAMVDDAKRYLQEYQIRSITGDDETQSFSLWAKFDQNLLRSALAEYNVPVWGQDRPETVFWVIEKTEQELRFAPLASTTYKQNLVTTAWQRGLPIIIPKLDADDFIILNEQDIANSEWAKITTASKRYDADIAVTAIVSIMGSITQIEWAKITGKQVQTWQSSGSTMGEAINEGINRLADLFADTYTQQAGYTSQSSFEITVTGITGFSAYSNTIRYLESLNFINSVTVKSVNADRITYILDTQGDSTTLLQAIKLGNVLQATDKENIFRIQAP